jgi:hypothetical protein
MVPIRDPGLVGKKIDCPKCKYRFLVEEPVPEEDEAGEEAEVQVKEKAKSTAVTTKKGKGKLRDEDVPPDEEDESKGESKGKSNKVLYIGIGLGVVALVVLVGGGIVLFGGGGSKPSPAGGGGGGGAVQPRPNPAPAPIANAQPAAPAAPQVVEAESGPVDDLTNLLPNDTTVLVSWGIEKLRDSSVKSCLLETSGGFSESTFQRTFGFPLENVKELLTAGLPGAKPEEAGFFSLMRMKNSIDKDYLLRSLKLAPAEPVGGFTELYTVNGDLDTLSALLLRLSTPCAEKINLHIIDDKTLLFADATPMKKFLSEKRQPARLTLPPPQATDNPAMAREPVQTQPPPGSPPPGGNAMRQRKRGVDQSFPDVPNVGRRTLFQGPGGAPPPRPGPGGTPPAGPGGTPPPRPGPGGTPPAGPGGTPPPPAGPGATPPPAGPGASPPAPPPVGGNPPPPSPADGAGGKPGAAPGQAAEAEPNASNSYMTVDPSLKIAMDRLDREKVPSIFVIAWIVTPARLLPTEVTSAAALNKEELEKLIPAMSLPDGTRVVALALHDFTEIKLAGMAVAQTEADTAAVDAKALLEIACRAGIELLRTNWEMDVKLTTGSASTPIAQQASPFPQVQQRTVGGLGSVQGNFPPPGAAGGQAQSGKDGTVVSYLNGRTVAFKADLNISHKLYEVIRDGLKAEAVQLKGLGELVASRPRIHELARALQRYVKEKGAYPRGALQRPPSSERGIDWYPDQRLSWMVELLPYLGDGEFKDLAIDPDRSWNEGSNLLIAQVLIPQFLSPGDPKSAHVRYPGRLGSFAATRFVGVAGVGLDAAGYPAGDAGAAKLAGVFGYNRVTKPEDIRDEAEGTIALLQVPSGQIMPWLAGGGSTVRGVSDGDDAIKPFVCTEYKGKKGTFAIMADGKVRFIPEDIKPATFRAMCTIAGGERIDDLNEVAPVVPEDAGTEIKSIVQPTLPKVVQVAPETSSPAKPVPPTGAIPAAAAPTKRALLPGWNARASIQEGYEIALPPGKPIEDEPPSLLGGANGKRVGVLSTSGSQFSLTTTPIAAESQPKFFENMHNQLPKLMQNAKLAGENRIELAGGIPGLEAALQSDFHRVLVRVYLGKDRFYLLQVTNAETASPQDIDLFFDSFRVLSK